MGRSRVYCTLPANANRQHNTQAARSIPRDPNTRIRTRRNCQRARPGMYTYPLGYLTPSPGAAREFVTWTGNRIQGPIAVGM